MNAFGLSQRVRWFWAIARTLVDGAMLYLVFSVFVPWSWWRWFAFTALWWVGVVARSRLATDDTWKQAHAVLVKHYLEEEEYDKRVTNYDANVIDKPGRIGTH